MYETHWGLDGTPFRSRADRRFFYEGPTQEEALARLEFLVEEHRRLGLLIGPAGSGKSLLLEVFAERMRRRGLPVARIALSGIEPREFLWLVAAGFGVNADVGLPLYSLWRLASDRLAEFRYQDQGSAVLLDDADQASPEVLDQVARLAEIENRSRSRLAIVLAGREERLGKLGQRLLELAELRIDVQSWNAADTREFLDTALAEAGRSDPAFAPPAVSRLHELTGGVPRRVSQLADLSLLAGAGRGAEQIDADTVESVFRELGVVEV